MYIRTGMTFHNAKEQCIAPVRPLSRNIASRHQRIKAIVGTVPRVSQDFIIAMWTHCPC